MKLVGLLLILSLTGACASRPKLYPNEQLRAVGKKAAEKDVEKCIAEGDEYLESSKGKQVAKGAGGGAVVGAAFGAVTGLFTGNLGGSLARGAAVGAGTGAAVGGISPDQLKRKYVNQCLADKGYRVIGWD